MLSLWTPYEGSLFDEFRRMEEQMGGSFGGPWPSEIRSVGRGAFPPINVGTTPEQVDVYLFAPGLDPKSMNISIQQNLLTLSGERKVQEAENANYYRKERFTGAFQRAITLPEDVDPDQVKAHYREGILHITVQRREEAKPRQITVQ
jgi:HSP20 family protein